MRDRLEDLRKIFDKKGIKNIKINDEYNDSATQKMKEFLASISLIKNYIKSLDKITSNLKDYKQKGENALGKEEMNISKKIDEEVNRGMNIQSSSNTLMKNISEVIKIVKEEATEPEKRIIENLYASSIKNLQDKILNFQDVQSNIMNSKKENILRTAKINLNRDLTEEESKNILENPSLMQDMLKSKLLSGSHQTIQNALYDIEERHRDLMNLERNVKEVHRMFIDLSLLINLQGELIDNIEVNVKNAKESVLQAEEDLLISKDNLSSARKKKCIVLIIVVVLVLIICGSTIGFKLF